MSDINIGIGADTAGFRQAIANVQQSVYQAAVSVSSNFQAVNQTLSETRNRFKEINNTIGEASNGLETLTNITQIIRNSFRIASVSASVLGKALSEPLKEFSRWEDVATRLAPLVGGLEAAKDLATHLRDEAANGTMSLEQLAGVAGKLSSVFKNSDDIRKWTTIFHNLSAGTGLDINELIGNFTKLKAAGRVTGEFPEMFAQKGVNIFGELEKQTGKTTVELRKMAMAGTLSFSEIEKALEAVATGTGQFAGQAGAMSNTFGGSVGTMVANWKILLAEFAKPIAESVTPWIQGIGTLFRESAGAGEVFGGTLARLAPLALALAGSCKILHKSLLSVLGAGSALTGGIVALVAVAGTAVLEAWINSMKEEAREAGKAVDLHKRLQASFDAMETATTVEQLREATTQTRRLVDALEGAETSLNTDVIRDNIKAIEEKTRAEIALAAATAKRAEADAKAAEDHRKAQELWTKFSQDRKIAADKQALDAVASEARPELLLKQNGFDSYEEFYKSLNWHRAANENWLASEQGSEWMVNKVNEMEELQERYLALVEAANSAAEAQAAAQNEAYAKADAAKRAAQTRIDLLRAEISGNAKLVDEIKTRERYEALLNQHLSAGIDYDKAQELATEEAAAEYAKARQPGGSSEGTGRVKDDLASVGGGRSMLIGADATVSVARSQLSVMRTMVNHLAGIKDNTSRSTSVFA